MDSCHDLFPQSLMEVTGIIRKFLIVIITGPYCTGIIWSISYEPEVIIGFSSTCFAGNSHVVKLAGGTCTFLYNIFHGACEQVCCTFFDHGTSGGSILDQYVSAMIQDLCVVDRFDVGAAVSDSCVGSTQFYVCDTSGDTAKCSSKVRVTPYIAVGICICFCTVGKCSESEVIQILKTKFRSYLLQTFYCHYVDGVLDRCTNSSSSIVRTGCVVYRRTVRIFIGFIFEGSC